MENSARTHGSAIVYFEQKLGGEISIPRTDRSPEFSFDFTLVEIVAGGGALRLGRYGIIETQTMEFHGSYRHAVKNLQDALRLHRANFHDIVAHNQSWVSDGVEGPNIANVFKRMFYQMMFKFQIGKAQSCAGVVLALPRAVWDSWQHHLGKPVVSSYGGHTGVMKMTKPGSDLGPRPPAWIYVFDIDADGNSTPNPITIVSRIATNAEAVAYYALEVSPAAAFDVGGPVDLLPRRIQERLRSFWPDFGTV